MVSSLFTIELYFHVITLIIAWPIYVAQHLALRFTHKKRLIPTKVYLILIGTVGCTIQTIRTVDPSAAFGRLNIPATRSLYNQFGYICMYGVILVVIATAKTLCVQIHRQVPNWFIYSVWGIQILAHAITTVTAIPNGVYWPRSDYDNLMVTYKITLSCFTIDSLVILAIYWFLYFHLRKKIKEFLDQLMRQETAKVQSNEQLQQQFVIAQKEQQQIRSPTNAEKYASAAIEVVSSTLRDATTSPMILSVQVQPSTTQEVNEVGNMASDDEGTDMEEEQPTEGRPTIAIPATNPATVAPNSPTNAALNQHDVKYAPLYSAIRKMNILTVLLTILLVGTCLSQIQNIMALTKGGIINEVVLSPRDDDGSYRASGAIQAIVNQLSLFVILWYAWTPPSTTWFPSHLRQHHLEFWTTLRHGVKDSHEKTRVTHHSTVVDESRVSGEKGQGGGSAGQPTTMTATNTNMKRQKTTTASVASTLTDSSQPALLRPTTTISSTNDATPQTVQPPTATVPDVKDAW